MHEDAPKNSKRTNVSLISYGENPMISVNSDLYQKYKNNPNFQAFADNQMGKLIAAQQKRYDPKFFDGNTNDIKPSKLYQEYLKKSGLMYNKDRPNQGESN